MSASSGRLHLLGIAAKGWTSDGQATPSSLGQALSYLLLAPAEKIGGFGVGELKQLAEALSALRGTPRMEHIQMTCWRYCAGSVADTLFLRSLEICIRDIDKTEAEALCLSLAKFAPDPERVSAILRDLARAHGVEGAEPLHPRLRSMKRAAKVYLAKTEECEAEAVLIAMSVLLSQGPLPAMDSKAATALAEALSDLPDMGSEYLDRLRVNSRVYVKAPYGVVKYTESVARAFFTTPHIDEITALALSSQIEKIGESQEE